MSDARYHGQQERNVQGTVIKWLLIALAAVLAYLFVTRLMPWWANRVAGVVDASLTVGWLFGIFIGFVFTVLPIVVLWIGFRLRGANRTWKGWLAWLGAGVVAALPNLMTLGIVIGNSNTAHAGERKLDVEADGFRSGTVVGVALAVVAALGLIYLIRTRGWFRDQNRRLRSDAEERQ